MVRLVTAGETEQWGQTFATGLAAGDVILLFGPLGAGKTTLARGFLRGLGYAGVVRSPTYTLLEPYQISSGTVYHLDLYRLADPEELDYLGLRDLDEPGSVFLVEWPERGHGALPRADLEVALEHVGDGRVARLVSCSHVGAAWLERLERIQPDAEELSKSHQ